jgi:hypothetical protein
LTILDYKGYNRDESSAYPVLSLCFKNPFNKSKLEEKNPVNNEKSYLEFLEGKNFSAEMWKNDYENISFNISEYVLKYWMEWRNGSSQIYPATSSIISRFSSTFSGFWRQGFYNCYGVPAMNDVQMQWFSVLLKNDIFPFKIRPERHDFFIILHYPNQLLRSTSNIRVSWPEVKTNNTYDMKLVVEGTEIIKRRQKSKRPCNQDWKIYDSIVQERHSRNIGCRAPYQTQDNKLRPCLSAHEMEMARFALRYDEYGQAPPCTAMEKITYSYIESDLSKTIWNDKGNFWIGIYHRSQNFKEIVQIR